MGLKINLRFPFSRNKTDTWNNLRKIFPADVRYGDLYANSINYHRRGRDMVASGRSRFDPLLGQTYKSINQV